MDFKPVAPLTGDEYQMRAIRTMAPETDLMNVALGLAGEAGEFCDQIKKHVYHKHDLDHDHLIKELGDQLWYIAAGCKLLNVRLSDVMAQNINKLNRRYPDGFSSESSRNREEFLHAAPAGKVTVSGHITQIDKNIIPTYWGGAPVANDGGAITFEFSPNFPSTAPARSAPEQVGECGPEMKDRSADSAQALSVVEEDDDDQTTFEKLADYRVRADNWRTGPDELQVYDPDLDVFFRAYKAGGKTWVTCRGEDDVQPLDIAVRKVLDDIYAPKAMEEPSPSTILRAFGVY